MMQPLELATVPPALRIVFSLRSWDLAGDRERELAAVAVGHALRTHASHLKGIRYEGLRSHSLGGVSHRLAHYDRDARDLVLVPGGLARLGWDGSRLACTDDQRATWRNQLLALPDAAARPAELEDALRPLLLPARRVLMRPFLIETDARMAYEYYGPDAEDDALAIALATGVAQTGFRLATCDEWEWACRGGTDTFFRWGDQWPDGLPLPRASPFVGHAAPNAFGLRFRPSPYEVECAADGHCFMHGDGGSALNERRPRVECWFPYSPAYRYPAERAASVLRCYYEAAFVRRVHSILPWVLTAAPDAPNPGP